MAIIEIKNLKKVFTTKTDKLVALQDINLSIEKGEIFGIIGLSGAGKSTLVRMINFLETPTEGDVYFEDKNIGALNASELRNIRREIGMIFQNFNLLEQRNVLKNVLFPLEISGAEKESSIKRAKELLKLVDLSDKERAYPSQLSGGQKQRVAIARALATNPKVLLCDEATSALDPKTTNQILDLLKKINRELGVTVVIITHQMSVIENICDKVAILDQSRVVEMGNVKEVFKSPKSEIGKKLIFGATENKDVDFEKTNDKTCLRLAFDGSMTNEPIIANMVLTTNYAVSILYANSRMIDGKMLGQIIIELPDDKEIQFKIKQFLDSKKIIYWEV
ncbi:MAG: ATP-binding cassette domain-containing protein [Lachnospiraceae bacterium]|nr:ATP-binding cassette domain-containing protein [Lachnospiraceae bacterium]